MTNIPAGWYPDPSGTEQQRWWNGVSWGDQFAPNAAPVASALPTAQPYSVNATYAVPTAPAGTQPYTPWIWLLAVLPAIGILTSVVTIFTTNVDDLTGSASATNPFAYTPAEIISSLLGWVVIGLAILFGILDHRELRRRGVEQPFHWAFIFFNIIGAPVYMIGRSIVMRRRVGSGLAPMILNVALIVVGFIVGIAFAGSLFFQIFNSELSNVPS